MLAKILLVEDSRDIRDSIKEYLELEDFLVDIASDWEEWIEKALNNNYDLILLDVMLPKIDGYTIALKSSRKNTTPIIMLTAKWSTEDKLKWFSSWVIDYIVKPFDLRELEARIKAHLHISSSKIIEFWDIIVDLEKREFKKSKKDINISTKEFMIFKFLFDNKDKISNRTDIIEYVWGAWEIFDADAKLDVYISNLRRKLWKNIISTVKWVWYKINTF